jgi:hypothetical protein
MTVSNWLALEGRIRSSSHQGRVLISDPDKNGKIVRRVVVWKGGYFSRSERRPYVRLSKELRMIVGYEEEAHGMFPVVFTVK